MWEGIYKRLIRSLNTCLKKILQKSFLENKKFETALSEIEAILNSRSLTYLSSDAEDPSPFYSAHFLIGKKNDNFITRKYPNYRFTKKEISQKYNPLNLLSFEKKKKKMEATLYNAY